MEKFHLQKFISQVKNQASEKGRSFSWIKNVGSAAMDALRGGFGTEMVEQQPGIPQSVRKPWWSLDSLKVEGFPFWEREILGL